MRFWDGERLEPIKAFSQPYSVESASFCPEKGRFVAGGGDMWAHLHDYETGAELECNKGEGCTQHCATCAQLCADLKFRAPRMKYSSQSQPVQQGSNIVPVS